MNNKPLSATSGRTRKHAWMRRPGVGRRSLSGVFLLLCLLLVMLAPASALEPAQVALLATITVDRTDDTAGASATVCSVAGNDCSLRGATIYANTNPGTTIDLPAGTYVLNIDGNSEGGNCTDPAIGDLDVAGNNTTIQGAGAATTIIRQTTPNDRVICANQNLAADFNFTLSGVTITGGREAHGVGGGGLLSGADANNVTNISNVVFSNNQASGGGSPIGGGAAVLGTLSISNSTFGGSSAPCASQTDTTCGNQASGSGGGLYFWPQTAGDTLSLTSSSFQNNVSTSGNGGGLMLTGGGTYNVSISTFSGNQVNANLGNAFGGAIYNESGTLTLLKSTLTNNQALGAGKGGAVATAGALTMTYNRLVGNSAATATNGLAFYNNGGAANINNNWWASNSGPAANVVVTGSGTTTLANWLQLRNTPMATPILINQSTTLTASFLKNSAGNDIAAADLATLVGQAVTWGNAQLGSLSSTVTTIQANGTATALYSAGATGGEGSADAAVDSATATADITVNEPPSVTTQPISQTICLGQSVSFTAAARGYPAPTVQWQVKPPAGSFADIGGAISTTLTITPTAGDDGNQYQAVFSNGVGSPATSNPATLTVNVAPSVTTQPTSQEVTRGESVSFTSAGAGKPAPDIQWQSSTNQGGNWNNVSGAVTTTLQFITVSGDNGKWFRTVFSNTCGITQTNAVTLTVNTPPAVTTDPITQTICLGSSVTFTAAATGFPAPTVQWQVKPPAGSFANISGAISTTLTITPTAGDSGNQYQAVFTNKVGTDTTTAALLTVNVAAAVTTNPTDQEVTAGATVTFTAAAVGQPAPAVQWQRKLPGDSSTWGNIGGEISTTLSFPTASDDNGNQYRAVFSNTCGITNTNAAELIVNTPPLVTSEPSPQTVCEGESASFTAAASGFPEPTVRWYVSTDGGFSFQSISGEISTTLTITPTAGDDGNLYMATFTNKVGGHTSNAALLTVKTAPAVTTNPTSQEVTAGDTATFTAEASGSADTKPQWQSNPEVAARRNLINIGPAVQWQVKLAGEAIWGNVDGATSTTLSFATVSADNGNQYRAVFTNSCGTATTTAATLTVNTPPAVTTDPISHAVCAWQGPTTFTVAASGYPTPTVEWLVSTDGGSTFEAMTGEISTTLTITPTAAEDGNQYMAVFTNKAGAAASAAAVLTVNTAPEIATQPIGQEVTAGDWVTFTVAASGQPAPTVQWRWSGDGGASWPWVDGAISTTLEFSAASGDNGKQYKAVFTNLCGITETDAVTLTVNTPPAVTLSPTDETVCDGISVSFTAAATGDPTPTVQWEVSADDGVSWSEIAGKTSTTLTFTSSASQDGFKFRAVFTNKADTATTTAATLTVNTMPTVTTDPTNQEVTAGNNATFTAAAEGQPTPALKWQVKLAGEITWGDLGGETSTTLSFTAELSQNGNQYRAVFNNSCGTDTSAAATLTVNTAPEVTSDPTNQTVCEGTPATFAAAASGEPAPTVQWQMKLAGGSAWDDLAGEITTTLTITPTAGEDGNQYQAVFTNVAGTDTTSAATLTVNTAPAVTTQPTNQGVNDGEWVSFTAEANGQPTPGMLWFVSTDGGANWDDVAGAITPTLTFAASIAQDGFQYRAAFTNTCGMETSNAATLSVYIPPAVTTNPISQTVCEGSSVSFTAAASGDPTPAVQWQEDSGAGFADITGAISTTLTFTATAAQHGHQFQAVFTNPGGSDTTAAATLSVNTTPAITTQPANQSVMLTQPVTFSAAATSRPDATVKWQVSADAGLTFDDIPGAISTTLTFTPAWTDNGKRYRAVFTNLCTSTESDAAILTVNPIRLKLTKTADRTTVPAGWVIKYTIKVTNDSPVVASLITVTDTLPGGVTFVTADPAGYTRSGRRVVWKLRNVPAGATRTLHVSIRTYTTFRGVIDNMVTAATNGFSVTVRRLVRVVAPGAAVTLDGPPADWDRWVEEP